jgi:hypothetical protein
LTSPAADWGRRIPNWLGFELGGRSGAYIATVGRMDGGCCIGTRGAHPRWQTWLHGSPLSTTARRSPLREEERGAKGEERRGDVALTSGSHGSAARVRVAGRPAVGGWAAHGLKGCSGLKSSLSAQARFWWFFLFLFT